MAPSQGSAVKDVRNSIMSLAGEDLHAKRVYSRALMEKFGQLLPEQPTFANADGLI